MRVELFDFELPEDRIALRPAVPRDAARMLHVDTAGHLHDRAVRDLPELLRPGDVLVFNDTKVIPAQLSGIRRRGEAVASVSATLHMRTAPERWRAFVKPAKRLKAGDVIQFGETAEVCELDSLNATVAWMGEGGEVELVFEKSGAVLDEAIAAQGHIPLPPYIASKRPDDLRDRTDYQTIFARNEGAVAAPTAGLHFTEDLLEAIRARGVATCQVTLHVGAGTFLPVKADDTDAHVMHAEIGEVSAETAAAINTAKAVGGRVVSVGTTSLRLLESAAAEDGTLQPWSGATDIFITPGYEFRVIDALITNFHLPRSTLFMLVCALAGIETMQNAYRHAIRNGYRFYSYGDTSLIERAGGTA